jgi:choice-of-anchor B domain-containing protein
MNFKNNFFLSLAFILITSIITAQNVNVTLQGHLSYPNQTCANICGYVDSLGNEYALVGASLGMSIVDVSNPATPTEVLQVPGPDNLWKEIKVRGKYAYVTSEGGGGLQIINLSSLPNVGGVISHSWTGDGAIAGQLNTIHALHIDQNFVYLYGSNLFNGGAVVADITDPWNPTYLGNYEMGSSSDAYVHDGYVRNDTLYAGHIYSGYFSVVDFTDKANPIELVNQYTPNNFTHNTWLSTNGKTLFTTDEVDDSYLTSYDLSDLSNVAELDRIQSNPGSGSMVHNTHILNVNGNDFAVTSWYKDGFTIVDAGRPQNLVQVANYDTYAGSGGGSQGAWGVYPYLPSGTIIISNIDEGLFVLSPTYMRACYLEGAITNTCGSQLNNVQILVTAANINDLTDITGTYKTGTYLPGTYTVTFSRSGYTTQTISGVVLSAGNVTTLDVQMVPVTSTFTTNGLATDATTTNPIQNVNVSISNLINNYAFTSATDGTFNSCNVLSGTDYDVIAGKWGYLTSCASNQTIDATNNNLAFPLAKGYYDDFTFDFGWNVTTTASTGDWQRGRPNGTDYNGKPANPGIDVQYDCSDMAYVTGNSGTTGSDDDVDGGQTVLESPVFDMSTYTTPYVHYSRWFYNDGGSTTPNDSLCISVTNGSQTVVLECATDTINGFSFWIEKAFNLSDYISLTSTMRLIVKTGDTEPGHVVEAGFDKFYITEGPLSVSEIASNLKPLMRVYPNPFSGSTTISYALNNAIEADARIVIIDITGRTVGQIALTKAVGEMELAPNLISGMYFVQLLNGTEIAEPIKVLKMD